MIQGQALWGGIPDQDCAKVFPGELWKCYMGQYVHPYIQTPMLVHQESEDFVQLWVPAHLVSHVDNNTIMKGGGGYGTSF